MRGALRGAAGVGSLAAAGAANYFARVPNLRSDPRMSYFQKDKHGAFKRSRHGFLGGEVTPKHIRFDDDMDVDNGRRVGGFNTYNKRRAIGGKKMRLSKRRMQTLSTEVKPYILRYSAVSVYSGTGGYHILRQTRNSASNTSTVPVHLYDLTAVVNQGSATVCGSVGHGIQLPWTGGSPITYYPLRGSDTAGTNYQRNYYVSEQDFADQENQVILGNKAFHCWSDIRMVLYGMLTTPTKFTIQLVQFNDQDYCPEIPTSFGIATPTTVATNASGSVVNFYGDLSGPYVRNPILNNANKRIPQVMRVIATRSYQLDPRSTVSSDTTTPTSVEFKWFWRHNQIRNFDWNDTAPKNWDQATRDDSFTLQTAGSVQGTIDHSKRVYLMIRAQSLTSDIATEPIDSTPTLVNTAQPSYDLLIRNKYYTIS